MCAPPNVDDSQLICTIVQMDLGRPLRTVTPTVDGDVLTALAGADASFTVPSLHRVMGRHSEAGVRKAVHRLVDQGIVTVERAGRTELYRLNRDHLAAAPVIALANLRDTYIERLRTHIATWPVAPRLVMLFGSAARGDMDTGSDIDLFVVTDEAEAADDDPWAEPLMALVAASTTWTGNDTRILRYRAVDLVGDGGRADPVIESIRRDGIHVTGDASLLDLVAR
jgi:predicted nucleotidyltransferase